MWLNVHFHSAASSDDGSKISYEIMMMRLFQCHKNKILGIEGH